MGVFVRSNIRTGAQRDRQEAEAREKAEKEKASVEARMAARQKQELPENMLFEVSYVGNKGTSLVRTVDVNQAYPVPGFNQPEVQG